ncbi:MAG: bifunctional 5,10-methylene-tetrahydrofolate dehydrogenase/5,10-methylene-tetrahydrofolate cyclohydrolase, partial [Bacteroidales bacterium]|nr:bifunctional 5,10-methylene-tetrahydrofolate dehydrogenase/5,10-methylene-tetrahydrofolate cyclohydrolase [Bacteroidales bacterium]
MKLIDGKETAKAIKKEIAIEVGKMIDNEEDGPHLAAVLVGDDPASQTYVNAKEKACKEVGMMSSLYKFPSDVSEKEILDVVDYLNNDDEVDGFIVQLPLPAHIDENKVLEHINPAKDVDGFHPMNFGRMALNLPSYLPATPFGIIQLLERYKIETKGKNCVVLGRSHIVGSPISILLSRKAYPGDATVTVCHSRTNNLKKIASQADILIVAMGQPEFVTADMVK